ncbi:hypothetical protein F5146DRAFT_330653 [Armillaria mellea]|nr:hypothetical protein F5146DRAFT_330653 [Armillaria mellea]
MHDRLRVIGRVVRRRLLGFLTKLLITATTNCTGRCQCCNFLILNPKFECCTCLDNMPKSCRLIRIEQRGGNDCGLTGAQAPNPKKGVSQYHAPVNVWLDAGGWQILPSSCASTPCKIIFASPSLRSLHISHCVTSSLLTTSPDHPPEYSLLCSGST